jgi:hypothetical protein
MLMPLFKYMFGMNESTSGSVGLQEFMAVFAQFSAGGWWKPLTCEMLACLLRADVQWELKLIQHAMLS